MLVGGEYLRRTFLKDSVIRLLLLPGTRPLTWSCPFGPCNIWTFCTLPAADAGGLIWVALEAKTKHLLRISFNTLKSYIITIVGLIIIVQLTIQI